MELNNSEEWYNSQFPESQFLVAADNKETYKQRCIYGHYVASGSNVLICGIVRNAGDILHRNLACIKRLGSFFNNYHVYIYENDSTDNTKDILNKWCDPHFTIDVDNLGAPVFEDDHGPDRRYWMAYARNKYLEWARQNFQKYNAHYLIILDLDTYGFSYHGVLNSLGHYNWDAIGSNSIIYQKTPNGYIRLYYDSWAYREFKHPEAHEDKYVNLLKFNRGENLVRVNSCFGGLAIYKVETLQNDFIYGDSDCDHPTLNNKLNENNYRMFLNPSQIVLYNRHEYI